MNIAWPRSVSEAGNMFRVVAFPLAVLAVRQDPRDLAWAETAGTIGMFMGSLFTPLLIDRFSKLRGLIFSDVLGLLATLALAYGSAKLSLAWLFSGYFVMRAIDSFHHAALDAATTDRLKDGGRPLVAGFSELQLILAGGAVAGGLLAAQAVPLVVIPWLFLFDALSFVISSAWIVRIVADEKRGDAPPPALKRSLPGVLSSAWRDWCAGFDSALRDRESRKHLLGQSLFGFAFGLSTSTVRGHLLGTLHVAPAHYAYLAPSIRGFYLGGAFLNFRISKWVAPRTIAFLGGTLMLAGFLGMSVIAIFPIFVLFFGLQQLGNSFVVPVNRAAVIGGVPQSERGRVAAFRGLLIDATTVVGNVGAVWLIGFSTYYPLYVMAGVAALVLCLYMTIVRWEK